MYSFKKYFILLSIFFVSFFSSFFLKTKTSHLTGKQDRWKSPPIVVNCYHSFNQEKRVSSSVKFWIKKGFEIAFYESRPIKSICMYDQVEGIILIKLARYDELGENTLAFTKRNSSYGIIKSATIYVEYGTFNYPNLLEHEIGHALGIAHNSKKGNIMHPVYEMMGNEY